MEKAPYSSGVGKDVDEDTFSFAALDPSTKIKTPVSSQQPAKDPDSASGGLSPAAIFFFKGQLVPHPFPSPTASNPRTYSDLNRSGSNTTSVSKSEPLASSRGDSITSSSSRSGSSRQNSAKRLQARQVSSHPGVPLQQLLSSPAITPTVISRSKRSQRRNPESSVAQGINGGNASGVEKEKESQGKSWWVGRNFFRQFVSACRECRALESDKLPAIPRTR